MADVRLMFCVLLVVLIAAPNNHRRSFFFSFQEAERPTGGLPKIALDPLSVSFYSDDGFQPMQKELYNNNDKKTE